MITTNANNLQILYEDNHIIVVIKPKDILSQRDSTNDEALTDIVSKYIKDKYNKPGNVYLGLLNRLDRRVEGVMILGKSSKATSRLSEDIRNNNITKKYLAIVEGTINTNGKLVNYIKKDENKKIAIVTLKDDQEAKLAMLEYNVIKSIIINNKNYTLLDINLLTGRYNQIRCQFANINHPIMNDYKYKAKTNNNDIGLYCYHMEIIHPVTKEKMIFENFPSKGIWCKI